MLSGDKINESIALGHITISPFCPEHVGPNSVDLRLSAELLVYRSQPRLQQKRKQIPIELEEWLDVLDMAVDNPVTKLTIPAEGLVLVPGTLYIGSTVEYTESPVYVPGIEGRSSVGRLGINVHATAGFGDVGFKGTWTLEISVIQPVRVYPGTRICQIYFNPVEGNVTTPYNSEKYQGQRGPKPSQLWKDFLKQE